MILVEDHPKDSVVALAEAETLSAGQTSPQQRFFLGQIQANRAVAYEVLLKDQDAEAAHGRAITTLTALVADYSAVPEYRYSLAKEHLTFAVYFGSRLRTEEGVHHTRIAGPILERLVKESPKDPQFSRELARWRGIDKLLQEDLETAKKKKS